mmetsp:Transcript_38249/g.82496  ORF Transcript_38249/g.82496 Transcript_38249/m.82496 type:complete len:203 (-) Transcript_38249:395-1003(-)
MLSCLSLSQLQRRHFALAVSTKTYHVGFCSSWETRRHPLFVPSIPKEWELWTCTRHAAIGQHSEPDASWQRGNQVIAVPSWQIPSLCKIRRTIGIQQLPCSIFMQYTVTTVVKEEDISCHCVVCQPAQSCYDIGFAGSINLSCSAWPAWLSKIREAQDPFIWKAKPQQDSSDFVQVISTTSALCCGARIVHCNQKSLPSPTC